MLNYIQARTLFNEFQNKNKKNSNARKSFTVGSSRAFYAFRNLWDNYSGGLPGYTSIISELANKYGHCDEALKRWHPFGEVKDLASVPLDEVEAFAYASYMRRLSKTVEDREGNSTTIGRAIVSIADRLQRVSKTSSSFRREDLESALSLMLFRCAQGAAMEMKALQGLRDMCATLEGVSAEAAPSDMEKDDVDAILRLANGEVLAYVSIKNYGALSESTMKNYRAKGKTKPAMYVGYKTQGDESLTFLYPEGITSRTLAAKRLQSLGY